jgi:predicted nuclease of predicted toxin-antitoxin system
MDLTKVQFLLDENISYRLLPLFKKYHLNFSTLQKFGWSGVKNGELAKKVKQHNYILVTRDKDFTFLWKKYGIRVIYLAIKPPIITDLTNELESLFNHWVTDVTNPFLIIVQKGFVRLWK